jgi:hypothetical protein
LQLHRSLNTVQQSRRDRARLSEAVNCMLCLCERMRLNVLPIKMRRAGRTKRTTSRIFCGATRRVWAYVDVWPNVSYDET